MSGSECFSWCFEFEICNQFNHLRFGMEFVDLGFFKDWGDTGILPL